MASTVGAIAQSKGPCPLIIGLDAKGMIYTDAFHGWYRTSTKTLVNYLKGGCYNDANWSPITSIQLRLAPSAPSGSRQVLLSLLEAHGWKHNRMEVLETSQFPSPEHLIVVTQSEPTHLKLQQYYNLADVVAIVRVLSGDAERYDRAVYKAEVVQAFKGTAEGQVIYYGPFTGTAIGTNYLLFLKRSQSPIRPKDIRAPAYGRVAYNLVMNEGFGSMPISYECRFSETEQCQDAVRIDTGYVELPAGTKTSPPLEEQSEPNVRFVRKDDLIFLLDPPIKLIPMPQYPTPH